MKTTAFAAGDMFLTDTPSTQTDADLVRAFRAEEVVGEQLAPSYNVAPTQPVRAVLERTPREEPEAPPIRQSVRPAGV